MLRNVLRQVNAKRPVWGEGSGYDEKGCRVTLR